jgi:hypothetical protein
MSWFKRALGPVARTSSVRGARRLLGRVGAPGLNPELEFVHRRLDVAEGAVGALQRTTAGLDDLRLEHSRLDERVATVERHMPAVLNAVASTNGTARILRRELDEVAKRLSGDVHRIDGVLTQLAADVNRLSSDIQRLDGHIQDDVWPLQSKTAGLDGLYETTAWLVNRVETVRAEMMHELRYGVGLDHRERGDVETRIVNPHALPQPGSPLRLNLGCGHLPLDGYVNVDMRELPGVDVVAPVDALPFEAGAVGEIFSAHVLEHFPQAALERQLFPYWLSLLTPGGTFRAVVPDIDAMIVQYGRGEITFENLRSVTYGGQEYEGDFHHTAFTPESLTTLLEKAGFSDAEVSERGRVNGDCLEFEVVARRPG